jgi:hypothetical protein
MSEGTQGRKKQDHQTNTYSEEFFDEDEDPSVGASISELNSTTAFSVESHSDQVSDSKSIPSNVSSSAGGAATGDDDEVNSEAVVVSLMSTIQEEGRTPSPGDILVARRNGTLVQFTEQLNKSFFSSPIKQFMHFYVDNVPKTLEELQCFIEGAEDNSSNNSNSKSSSMRQAGDSSSELEKIMKKLDRLQASQNLLERALESSGMPDSEMEAVLQEAISNLPTNSKYDVSSKKKPEELEEDEDALSAEMKQLQEIIEDSEADRILQDKITKPNFPAEGGVGKEDTDFARVLREYDELEKSLMHSINGNSCDEQDSLVSEPRRGSSRRLPQNQQKHTRASRSTQDLRSQQLQVRSTSVVSTASSSSSTLTRTNAEVPLNVTNSVQKYLMRPVSPDERPISPMKQHHQPSSPYLDSVFKFPSNRINKRHISPSVSSPLLSTSRQNPKKPLISTTPSPKKRSHLASGGNQQNRQPQQQQVNNSLLNLICQIFQII